MLSVFKYLYKLTLLCDCVSGVQCVWSVTYSSTRVCGLEGASVVLPCRYDCSQGDKYFEGWWLNETGGIVREHSNSDYPDCSLNIDKLSDEHSGVYHFQFPTNPPTGRSGITVSVTRNDEHIQLTICFLIIMEMIFKVEATMTSNLSSQTCG